MSFYKCSDFQKVANNSDINKLTVLKKYKYCKFQVVSLIFHFEISSYTATIYNIFQKEY